ncbi:glucose dehydrogenase-like [FAD: quinone] [Leptotrombidium deliense]|uniref:Glucose dehydrogenase-like [FAD: quinone] n=1 Tax=Leptotrombidium deliense TaxID=299467 RepID=A0A443RYL1_9ACAR|nr:glucose dehydrogenase-like [FAD: quinone] [Leptotrombidium deliense]
MLYMRGSKYDYDGWEEMGATKWSWNRIFSTMNDIEDAHLTGVNESLHHRDGPIAITNEGNDKPILNKFKQAIKNLGYGEADPNDGELSGVGPVQFNYYQNQRRSSYYEYLYTYHKATNPKIESSSIATRIIFDENSKAIGVEYVKDGVKKYAKARNEIVVCAGAIETPKLLMLSGIGPKAHLDELNINVIADRPVGKNLHDHVGVILPVFNKTGAGESGAVVAFLKSSESESQSDIEMFSYLEGDFVFMGAILVKAESRGEIKLRPDSPNDKPVIDPQYLTEKKDRERLAKGVQTLFKIINEIDVTETGYEKMKLPPYPVCQNISKETLEYYECLLHTLTV